MDVYQENGFENRKAYLESLAESFDVDLSFVKSMADLLGETEDFDALVTNLEDYADDMNWK